MANREDLLQPEPFPTLAIKPEPRDPRLLQVFRSSSAGSSQLEAPSRLHSHQTQVDSARLNCRPHPHRKSPAAPVANLPRHASLLQVCPATSTASWPQYGAHAQK